MTGMMILKSVTRIAVISFALATAHVAQAAQNCEITQCRSGGNVAACWANMKREARHKAKTCNKVVIGSGVSSYAMALGLPGACIKANAVIKIHRPYHPDLKAVALDSRMHNFYFGRLKPRAISYFRAHGGMQRDGLSNAMFMVSVPAANTGLPICDAQ
jgi:hypothetical protein